MASSSAGQIARDKQKNVKTTASAGQVTITSFAASAPRESFGSARDSAEVLIERKQFHVGDILSWLFLAPWWLSTIYAMLLTLVILAALYLWGGPRQDDTFAYHVDLAVYVFIYSTWFTVFLPQLLVTLNFKLLLHTGGIIFKLFFAESAVIVYSWYRGHLNVLRPGISMLPVLEADRPGVGLGWLGEAGYNLRQATLLSGAIVSFGTKIVKVVVSVLRGDFRWLA